MEVEQKYPETEVNPELEKMPEPSGTGIKKIAILTSGGDAPGMNAAIRAFVRRGRSQGLITYGVQRGYAGLMNEEIIEMQPKDVSDIIGKGGTILNTARSSEMRSQEGIERAAEVCRTHGIEGLVVVGGDGSFAGAGKLANCGINTIGVPGTIDLDIGCTEYTIGFDTAVNTAREAIDKVRDTSAAHERVSIIEVMGRDAGYIALWAGIGAGAEEILLPELYDYNEKRIIDKIKTMREKGKNHFIIINAEGIGESESMAAHIEKATGIEARATILGYMQRGGSPTSRDRMYGTVMGAYAVDLLLAGKSKRVVVVQNGKLTDMDINEALAMKKQLDPYETELSRTLSIGYSKI